MNKQIWQKVLDIVKEVQGTDIEMGEEFEVEGHEYEKYKMTELGLEDVSENYKHFALHKLIRGVMTIKPKKWLPKNGDKLYYICFESSYGFRWTHYHPEDGEHDNVLASGMYAQTEEGIKEMLAKIKGVVWDE